MSEKGRNWGFHASGLGPFLNDRKSEGGVKKCKTSNCEVHLSSKKQSIRYTCGGVCSDSDTAAFKTKADCSLNCVTGTIAADQWAFTSVMNLLQIKVLI